MGPSLVPTTHKSAELSRMGTKETTESAMGASITEGLPPSGTVLSGWGSRTTATTRVHARRSDPCQRAVHPHHSCRKVNLGPRHPRAPGCCEPDDVDGGGKRMLRTALEDIFIGWAEPRASESLSMASLTSPHHKSEELSHQTGSVSGFAH